MELQPVGEYKVAYWKDGGSIRSLMFNCPSKAEAVADLLSEDGYAVTLMELRGIDGSEYEWKLLKGGVSPFFGIMTQLYRHRILLGAMGVGFLLLRGRD